MGPMSNGRRTHGGNGLAGSKLILGGHSFIGPLGSDAEASVGEQRAIVEACLAQGITVFDTTYAPERLAWARAISRCRQDERERATPIVWNFFGHVTDPLPGPLPWTSARWEEALRELSPWEGLPVVVVHELADRETNARQIDVVRKLKDEKRVTAVGHWPGKIDWSSADAQVWDFVVAPWNVKTARETRPVFQAARAAGRVTLGTSPFTRGWELDRLAQRCSETEHVTPDEARRTVADAMLRFSAFSEEVDHVVVAMRQAAYVERNLDSLRRGKLTAEEMQRISG
jgi:aryl-alcohol dehydrogenase-like predicted oxidoreductase